MPGIPKLVSPEAGRFKLIDENTPFAKGFKFVDEEPVEGQTILSRRKEFVTSPDGDIDFGQIPLDVDKISGGRYPESPIRLEKGSDQYGHEHIGKERKQEIIDIGYKNEVVMLYDVTKNFTQIYEQPNGRLLLVKKNGKSKYAVVELQKQPDNYYGVTTWFLEDRSIKKKPYEERSGRKLLLDVARTPDTGLSVPFPNAGD